LSQGASGSIAGPARPALGAAPRSCVLTCAAGGPRSASAALPIRPRPPRDIAAGLLQATSLPFLVTAATSMQVGTISSVAGAALICAGLLSVVIFPAAALSRLREHAHPNAASAPASPSDASAHSEAM
jgi:hypothetical protein